MIENFQDALAISTYLPTLISFGVGYISIELLMRLVIVHEKIKGLR